MSFVSPVAHSRRSRRLAAVVTCGVAMLAAMPAIASADSQVIAFPERDFLSGDGFTAGQTVNYKVTHTNGKSYTASVRADLDGLAEVNHPGGVCWSTMTPDVKAGDVITADDGVPADAVTFTVPNTQVQRVTNPAPGTIVVKGWASTDGGPTTPGTTRLPDDQVESRIVAPRNLFDASGKRTLRASPTDTTLNGTFAWDSADPTVTTYTATYTGLDANDVSLAMSVGEARTLWLGSDPLNPRDGSIFESGDAVIGGSSTGFCDGTAGSFANIPSETPSTNLNPGLTPAGVARPALSLSNTQMNYSAKPGGSTNTQTLTVKNSGSGALSTFSVVLTQPNRVTQPTAVTPSGVPVYQVTSDTCTGKVVSAGKSCQLQIKFTSPSAAGTYVGDVTISAQDIDGAVATRSAKMSGNAK
jgi:hypothetical protein